MTKPKRTKRVAVLTETSRAFGRELIAGIARYSREQTDWELFFEPRGLEGPPPWLPDWEGDGIIARFPDRKVAETVLSFGKPVVDLYGTLGDGFPMVGPDNAGVAALAFEHLWERGIRHFGYWGLRHGDWPFIDERGELFRQRAEEAGCDCTVSAATGDRWVVSDWGVEEQQLMEWIETLPKPVGILACYDERGLQVLNACRHAGWKVPDEVAVIGSGNDPVVCEMCSPPLSSIDLDGQKIGYKAAACLDRLMRKKKTTRERSSQERPTQERLRIEPRGIIVRRSTDVLVTEDADLAAALRFIRREACHGIRVRDILREVPVSQSVLERKFHAFLGRTPKSEILRVQMDRAREFLAMTDLPFREVATRCGFSNEKYFSDVFFRETNTRPISYRRDHRGG